MVKKFIVSPPGSKKACFSCTVQVRQCVAQKRNGQQCQRKTTVSPLCTSHMQTILGIKVAPVPGMGRGLFAIRDIPRDTVVAPLGGGSKNSIVGMDVDMSLRYGQCTEPYAIRMQNPDAEFDFVCDTGAGSMADHTTINQSNVKFVRGRSTAVQTRIVELLRRHPGMRLRDYGVPWIQTTKRVKAGTELRVYYGRDYNFDPTTEIAARYKNVGPRHRITPEVMSVCRAMCSKKVR